MNQGLAFFPSSVFSAPAPGDGLRDFEQLHFGPAQTAGRKMLSKLLQQGHPVTPCKVLKHMSLTRVRQSSRTHGTTKLLELLDFHLTK